MKFEQSHQDELRALIADLTLSGETLEGKFGSNTVSPWDFINLQTLNSVEGAWKAVKRKISALNSDSNPWGEETTDSVQSEKLRVWERFLFLTIGYKTWKADENARAAKKAKLASELERLVQENKTPAERIAELKAELEAV